MEPWLKSVSGIRKLTSLELDGVAVASAATAERYADHLHLIPDR